MFGLVVRFDLKEETASEFDKLASETLNLIKTEEPGTLLYGCHKVTGEPNARIFYELYTDREAFDAHEQTPHVLEFLSQRDQYFSAPLRVEFFDSFDGKGEVFASQNQ